MPSIPKQHVYMYRFLCLRQVNIYILFIFFFSNFYLFCFVYEAREKGLLFPLNYGKLYNMFVPLYISFSFFCSIILGNGCACSLHTFYGWWQTGCPTDTHTTHTLIKTDTTIMSYDNKVTHYCLFSLWRAQKKTCNSHTKENK